RPVACDRLQAPPMARRPAGHQPCRFLPLRVLLARRCNELCAALKRVMSVENQRMTMTSRVGQGTGGRVCQVRGTRFDSTFYGFASADTPALGQVGVSALAAVSDRVSTTFRASLTHPTALVGPRSRSRISRFAT